MSNALIELSVEQLRRAVEIKEQIEALQNELNNLTGGVAVRSVGRRRGPGRPRLGRPPGRGPGRPKGGRGMSAAGRAAIAAAQRARWARQKGQGSSKAAAAPGNGRRGKRRMTPEWRQKLAAAARERWAKAKREGKTKV